MRVVLADLQGWEALSAKTRSSAGTGHASAVLEGDELLCQFKRRFRTYRACRWLIWRQWPPRRATRCLHARRPGRRRRRDRPVVARGLPARDGVGRRHARPRLTGRLRRPGGLEDAGALRRPCRLHHHRRAGRGVRPPAAGRALSGVVCQHGDRRLDALPFPRWDLLTTGSDTPRGVPGSSGRCTADSRCWRAAAVRSSAPIARIGFCRPTASDPCAASSTSSSISAAAYDRPYVVFRDPLFSQDRERCLALCDEILEAAVSTLRFECETRLDRLDDGRCSTACTPPVFGP